MATGKLLMNRGVTNVDSHLDESECTVYLCLSEELRVAGLLFCQNPSGDVTC